MSVWIQTQQGLFNSDYVVRIGTVYQSWDDQQHKCWCFDVETGSMTHRQQFVDRVTCQKNWEELCRSVLVNNG